MSVRVRSKVYVKVIYIIFIYEILRNLKRLSFLYHATSRNNNTTCIQRFGTTSETLNSVPVLEPLYDHKSVPTAKRLTDTSLWHGNSTQHARMKLSLLPRYVRHSGTFQVVLLETQLIVCLVGEININHMLKLLSLVRFDISSDNISCYVPQ